MKTYDLECRMMGLNLSGRQRSVLHYKNLTQKQGSNLIYISQQVNLELSLVKSSKNSICSLCAIMVGRNAILLAGEVSTEIVQVSKLFSQDHRHGNIWPLKMYSEDIEQQLIKSRRLR
jgi:hypothetical protein